MGRIWGRQVPGGPHVGTMNFAIWVGNYRGPVLNTQKYYKYEVSFLKTNYLHHENINISYEVWQMKVSMHDGN